MAKSDPPSRVLGCDIRGGTYLSAINLDSGVVEDAPVDLPRRNMLIGRAFDFETWIALHREGEVWSLPVPIHDNAQLIGHSNRLVADAAAGLLWAVETEGGRELVVPLGPTGPMTPTRTLDVGDRLEAITLEGWVVRKNSDRELYLLASASSRSLGRRLFVATAGAQVLLVDEIGQLSLTDLRTFASITLPTPSTVNRWATTTAVVSPGDRFVLMDAFTTDGGSSLYVVDTSEAKLACIAELTEAPWFLWSNDGEWIVMSVDGGSRGRQRLLIGHVSDWRFDEVMHARLPVPILDLTGLTL